jgi:putative hydrolase of the HAD superfamily
MRAPLDYSQDKVSPLHSCVVFDVDDTLYLEHDYVRSGFRAVEEAHGIVGFADAAWTFFSQGVRGNIFNQTLSELGLEYTGLVIQELVHSYRVHEPRIALLPDAARWFEVHSRSHYIGCITDGPTASQRAKLRVLGVRRQCDYIILTDELGKGFGKPDIRSFQMISQLSTVHASKHVYVADNPAKDFQGPKSLGWRTVRVRRTSSLHMGIHTPRYVDAELPDLSNLAPTLTEFFM